MRHAGFVVLCTLSASMLAAGVAGASTPKGQWIMPGKNYAADRYSKLDQITLKNASHLHPVWSFSTGVLAGAEGQPLVVGNTMYVVTPWPDVLYAFNLTKKGYPLRWKFRPNVSPDAIGEACCDSVNRGAVYADGMIIYNLLDGHTVAVNARTGKLVWETHVAHVSKGETITMAPLVADNRVIVGISGGEFAVFGWVKGLDLKTGKVVWTAHNMGTNKDMLVEPGKFHPPYVHGSNLGVSTWPGDSWKHGGGPVWGWLSYDPHLDLLYYGVGNPSPYNPAQRLGDNKWTDSVLARRPGDGDLVWAYQFTPHDNWDYDSTGAMVLATLTIHGKPVKVLVHFDKNGFAYTLDRKTGKVLVAAKFAPGVNWAKSINLETGRPVLNPAKQTGAAKGMVKNICPSLEGGVSPASPPAYSPRTHLFYTSMNNICMNFKPRHITPIRELPVIGTKAPYHPGPGGYLGAFIAWNAAKGKIVWEDKEPFPNWSGALVTAGNVVFFGTLDGWFESANALTGKVLSRFKVGSGVVGAPVTFLGPDGKQYVAIYAGIGGDWSLLAGDADSDVPTDIRSPPKFAPTLAAHTSQGGIVWIFGVGGSK